MDFNYIQRKRFLFILHLWVQFICIKYFLIVIKFLPEGYAFSFFFFYYAYTMYYENALSFYTKLFHAIKIVTISSNESLLEQLFVSIGFGIFSLNCNNIFLRA